MEKRLNSSATLKQEFLEKWIKGLQICTNLKKDMNTMERKNAIKVSSNVAIASTRHPTTHWSRAILSDVLSRNHTNRILVEQISGRNIEKMRASTGLINKILRKSRGKARRVVPKSVKASFIAKKLLKNKTRVLKRLVPGGKELDGISLIKETLDYIVSLRVQVDVMGHFVNVAEK